MKKTIGCLAAFCLGALLLTGCPVPTGQAELNLPPFTVPEPPPLEYPLPDPLPAEPTRTGQPGPGGGTIIDGRDLGLKHDLEVRPYTADTALTWYEAAALTDPFGGSPGWRLVTYTELAHLYHLCLVRGKLPLERFSPYGSRAAGLIWTKTNSSPAAYAMALDLSLRSRAEDLSTFVSTNFVPNYKNTQCGACYVRRP
ncbi:MAG: hypothetical protein LBG84_07995 [Treponema sp.]|jgi:hypothetical protein|nr:hypothetical protein [Treponema sp.]